MTNLNDFMSYEFDGFFCIGHSSALLRINGKLFLFDPQWGTEGPYGDNWCFSPPQFNCDSILDKLDGCFISHIHNDHWSKDILKKLKCPIHIMGDRPEFYTRIFENKSEKSVIFDHPKAFWSEISKGVSAWFIPHPFNSIDSSVIIKSDNFSFYHGSDNFLSEDSRKFLPERWNRTDVGMVPYASVNIYPSLLEGISEEERLSEHVRLNAQCAYQAALTKNMLGIRTAIPSGANLFYSGGKDHPLNKFILAPSFLAGFTPMKAGDYLIYKDVESLQFIEKEDFYDEMMDGISNQTSHSTLVTKVKDPNVAEKIAEKIKKQPPIASLRDNAIVINGVYIDLNSLKVSIGIPEEPAKFITEFKIDDFIFQSWLTGSISFEEVIGSRRFRYERRPNVYNQKVMEFTKYL